MLKICSARLESHIRPGKWQRLNLILLFAVKYPIFSYLKL